MNYDNYTRSLVLRWFMLCGGLSLYAFGIAICAYGSGYLTHDSIKSDTEQARRIAFDAVKANFEPSLNSRECVDFLLAPAILMQEEFHRGVEFGCNRDSWLATNGVRFDTIMTHVSTERQNCVTIFARYWVNLYFYQMTIVWAEPQGRGLDFPVYPPSLTIKSDADIFSLHHETIERINQKFKKPTEQRDAVFRFMFGDYPVANLRYAEHEALAERLYRSDFEMLESVGSSKTNIVRLNGVGDVGQHGRIRSEILVGATNGRIDSLQFFDEKHKPYKNIVFHYEEARGVKQLSRQIVSLQERPIEVGFRGKGIKVGLNGVTNTFTELPGVQHKGGRTCVVDYESDKVGSNVLRLPVSIEVRNATNGNFLRSVKMHSFKPFDPSEPEAMPAIESFSNFTEDQSAHRNLMIKYWQKPLDQVPKVEAESIRALLTRVKGNLNTEDITVGEQLRSLSMIIELSRLIGDQVEMNSAYRFYFAALQESGLSEVTLEGGYAVIEASIHWGHLSEANVLLPIWLDAAAKTQSAKAIRKFADSKLRGNNYWCVAQLLDKYSGQAQLSPGEGFELEAIRCIALQEARKLFKSEIAPKDISAKVQYEWATNSISADRLDEMVASSKKKALALMATIERPSSNQKSMLDRLE